MEDGETINAPATRSGALETFPVLVGTSGRQYRGVNLLTELGTRQKNAARDCIAPVLPLVLAAMLKAQGIIKENGIDGLDNERFIVSQLVALLAEADIEAVFNAMVHDDLDLRLLAVICLPVDDRTFRSEDVEARVEDLMDIPYDKKFEVFRSFFSSSGRSFLNTSPGSTSMPTMMTTKTRNRATTPSPGITSS